jgi:nucleotide-binding universal stress UspA family protein
VSFGRRATLIREPESWTIPSRGQRMKKILCGTDLSMRAELAVDRAIALARQFDADLRLLHVVDEDQPGEIVDLETERARAALEARIAALRGPTVRVECAVKPGIVFQTIVDTAQTWNADLLVLGAHRRRILRDVIVGTTIERVMRNGRHPVLMVNSATFVPYESVLLALDASEASARAVRAAHSLGLLADVRVSVVHAFEPLYKGMMGWAGLREDTIAEYSAGWARDAAHEIREFLRQLGCDATRADLVLEEGRPFVSIERAVERLRPHLLVVGTHGRGVVTRALLGSVAERVISHIECDILAVPRAAESLA